MWALPRKKMIEHFLCGQLVKKISESGAKLLFKKNLSFSLSVFVWVCVRLCVCPCKCGILLPCCVWRIENKLGHQFLPSLFEMGLSFIAKYVRLGSSRAVWNILVCLPSCFGALKLQLQMHLSSEALSSGLPLSWQVLYLTSHLPGPNIENKLSFKECVSYQDLLSKLGAFRIEEEGRGGKGSGEK